MASVQKHGARWRVQVYVGGKRESRVFSTRREAEQWAVSRQAELAGKRLPDKTLTDALRKHANEVSPARRGERWELLRLSALERMPISKRRLAGLTAADLSEWRDARLKTHAPATVARELNLLRSVLEYARREWGWIRVNPLQDVRWPSQPKGRARRVTSDEIEAVRVAFGQSAGYCASTATQRVGLMFFLALETAMRSGEMCGLRWSDVHLTERFVVLPRTKNGDRREVPLSSEACKIISALPKDVDPIFGVDDRMRDALWRKTRPKSVVDLHFHDSRSEAIWRLSKKLDVLQLARVIGHRDLKSLMIYYNESAADLAKMLS